MRKDVIAASLGILPLAEEIKNLPSPSPLEPQELPHVLNDFNTARDKILDVIEVSSDAVSNVAELANKSQSPRMYEVLATLMKTNIEASRELLNIQNEIRDINKKDRTATLSDSDNIRREGDVTNNLVIGTSEEILNMIRRVSDEHRLKVIDQRTEEKKV